MIFLRLRFRIEKEFLGTVSYYIIQVSRLRMVAPCLATTSGKIFLMYSFGGGKKIYVEDLKGKTITLDVGILDTIGDVKLRSKTWKVFPCTYRGSSLLVMCSRMHVPWLITTSRQKTLSFFLTYMAYSFTSEYLF